MRAAIALILVTAGSAAAGNNEITLGSWNRALRSASADAVTDRGLAGGLLTYARALDVDVMPRLALWAEAGFAWAGTSGTMFETMNTDVGNLAFTVGGRARYLAYDHLAVSARLDIGTARTSLTLSQGGYSADDSGWGAVATGAVAVDLLAASWLGLRVELAYVKASAPSLSPHQSGDDGTLKLPMSDASFGHLDLSGPAFYLSLVSQF